MPQRSRGVLTGLVTHVSLLTDKASVASYSAKLPQDHVL